MSSSSGLFRVTDRELELGLDFGVSSEFNADNSFLLDVFYSGYQKWLG
jgi:hypothetical protein